MKVSEITKVQFHAYLWVEWEVGSCDTLAEAEEAASDAHLPMEIYLTIQENYDELCKKYGATWDPGDQLGEHISTLEDVFDSSTVSAELWNTLDTMDEDATIEIPFTVRKLKQIREIFQYENPEKFPLG